MKNSPVKVTLRTGSRDLSGNKKFVNYGVFVMPDIKQVLNEEIRRLARKELKSVLPLFAKQISEQRKQISELKKQIAALEKRLPEKKVAAPVAIAAEPEDIKKLRLNAAGIVKIRTKLGISQGKFAELLGVSGHTVSLWEIGKISPRANAKAAICALRTVGKRELKRRLAALAGETENNQE